MPHPAAAAAAAAGTNKQLPNPGTALGGGSRKLGVVQRGDSSAEGCGISLQVTCREGRVRAWLGTIQQRA